jgi:peptidoglycan/LPS O-acetylase OafA/YrhL
MLPPPSDRPSDRYRPDIEGLRAVAVVLVVLFQAFPAARPGGFIGVDIFFLNLPMAKARGF